ncbi:MAG: hypothetical protein ACJ77N_11510 [Chloroflexota bacterium]
MDPSIAALLSLAFVAATGITAYELRSALDPPHCPECTHCQTRAIRKQRAEQELREWYARRWGFEERDEDERRRRR